MVFSNYNNTTYLPFNGPVLSKKATYMSFFSSPLFYWSSHLPLPSEKEMKHFPGATHHAQQTGKDFSSRERC